MVINLIRHVFSMTGHQWRIGGVLRSPTEDDIRMGLDEAVGVLYSDEYAVGDTLLTGGLIIEKRPEGYDVYVRVGTYN